KKDDDRGDLLVLYEVADAPEETLRESTFARAQKPDRERRESERDDDEPNRPVDPAMQLILHAVLARGPVLPIFLSTSLLIANLQEIVYPRRERVFARLRRADQLRMVEGQEIFPRSGI